jgi:hypothetical protein
MSPDELLSIFNQYALDPYVLFATALLVVVAMGLLLWKRMHKIEVRFDHLRREVNRLKVVEERRLLLALPSGSNGEAKIKRAEPSNPSIAPEITDNRSAETRSGSNHDRN